MLKTASAVELQGKRDRLKRSLASGDPEDHSSKCVVQYGSDRDPVTQPEHRETVLEIVVMVN